MRIRTIKPEFTQDEDLSTLPAETHLLAAGLLCYADDEGYFNANPALVKAAIFPTRDTKLTAQTMLEQLAKIGFIRLGTAGGKRYGYIRTFCCNQVISHPRQSKLSQVQIEWDSDQFQEPSSKIPVILREASILNGMERNGIEGKGRERARGAVPTLEECKAYFSENGSDAFEGERFFLFYDSKGWKVGKTPMVKWRSAAGNWISRNKKDASTVRRDILGNPI